MFKRVIIFFSLLGNQLETTAHPIPEQVQAAVDHYTSPDVCQAFVQKGERLAAQFNRPAFMDQFLHAEELQQAKYHDWYNTVLLNPSEHGLPILRGDATFACIAGAGWGIEYFLFNQLHHFFKKAYATPKALEPNFFAYQQSCYWGQLVFLAVVATVTGLAFKHSAQYLHIDSWLTSEPQQAGAVHTLASPIKKHLINVINPQTWFDTCNSWLEYANCIPDWSKTTSVNLSKAVLCNLACIIFYEHQVIQPQWTAYCQTLGLEQEQAQQKLTPATYELFASTGLPFSFLIWIQNKYYITALCNTCISGIITVAGAVNAYQKIQPLLKDQPCLPVS